MLRRFLLFLPLALFLALPAATTRGELDPVDARTIAVSLSPVDLASVQHSRIVKPVAGWILHSRDPVFGGLSGLIVQSGSRAAVSDAGVLMRFSEDWRNAAISQLPRACIPADIKTLSDSESLVEAKDGTLWAGFEWQNRICRLTAAGGAREFAPPAMRDWPKTGGAEAMAILPGGRFVAIAERPVGGGPRSPLLVFDRDPTDPAAKVVRMTYQPPIGFRPTDAKALPDGRILVLNRRFEFPFSFSGVVTLLPPIGEMRQGTVKGRPIIVIASNSELADNYEGLGVEEAAGRTYVWLVSDDNFVPQQETYLLKFELLPSASSRAASPRS